MSIAQEIVKVIEQLPKEAQQEVEAFVQGLLERYEAQTEPQLQLDWRGALSDLKDQYTSVELQHDTIDLWNKSIDAQDE